MPGSSSFQLELLQQISVAKDSDSEIGAGIKVRATATELASAMVMEINTGWVLRRPDKFVVLVTETSKLGIEWPPVINAAATRLRTPDVAADECRALTILLLAIATIGQQGEALTMLKTLVHQGYLSHTLYLHRKNGEARAAIVAAISLASPPFERPQQVEQSANGDTAFNKLVDAQTFDPSIVEATAAVITSVRAGSRLFTAGSASSKIGRFAAAVLSSMVQNSYSFGLEPKMVVERKSFLETQFPLSVVARLLVNMQKGPDLLTLLVDEAFQVDRGYLYLAALELATKVKSASYFDFLQQGLLALDQPYWEQNLATISPQFSTLIELCSRIKKTNGQFGLSTAARDALLSYIRRLVQGDVVVQDDVRDQLARAIELLQEGQSSSLVRDIEDDMAGSTEPSRVQRAVELVGGFIKLDAIPNPDRIVRRILTPLLTSPTEAGIAWMLAIIKHRSDMRDGLGEASKQEFAGRINGLIQNPRNLSESTVANLQIISGLLELDVAEAEREQ